MKKQQHSPKHQNHNHLITTMQQRTEGMNQIDKKRNDFKKDIRKNHLESIFRAKRKLFLQNHHDSPSKQQSFPQNHQKTLIQTLCCIEANYKDYESICSLVNLLALQKPFEHYSSEDKNPSKEIIENFCSKIVNLFFTEIIPRLFKDIEKRMVCLNAIANLFADPLCPNQRYVKITVQNIDCYYGGIDIWGMDKEMIEVYYMISNLMRKSIVQTDFLSIQKLLAWVQRGIQYLPSNPLKFLIQGCFQLFNDIDEMYNSAKNSLFTDHFRPSRQIIIENLLKRTVIPTQINNKGDLSLDSDTLLHIFRFFSKNKEYLLKIFSQWEQDQQDKNWIKLFIEKVIYYINQQTLKSKTIQEIGNFFVNLLTHYPEHAFNSVLSDKYYDQYSLLNRSIQIIHKLLLTAKNLSAIMLNICSQPANSKLIYLNVMKLLLQRIQETLNLTSDQDVFSAFQFILINRRMEEILTDFILEMNSKIRSIQILKAIVEIYAIVIDATDGKLGHKIMNKFSSLLQIGSAYVPEEIYLLINKLLTIHSEKMETVTI